jgi:acylphosphatase
MRTVKIFISGSVQGVFFRKFIEEKARKLMLKGFVRNSDDGRVEVVVEGNDSFVNGMIDVCKEGPAQAQISGVEVQELKHHGFDEFKILSV